MRARLVPVLLTLSVSVGACSDGGAPSEAATTRPPITESPSPSPEPDAVPPQATEATPEGAAEFVRFFYAEVERAYAEREPSRIAELAAPNCQTCERFIASVTQLRDQNQRSEGLVYEIVSAVAPPLEGNTARVDVVYNGPEAVRYDSDNNVINREPAAKFVNEQVDLLLIDGSWRVREVTRP
jgi:hypothetical protein